MLGQSTISSCDACPTGHVQQARNFSCRELPSKMSTPARNGSHGTIREISDHDQLCKRDLSRQHERASRKRSCHLLVLAEGCHWWPRIGTPEAAEGQRGACGLARCRRSADVWLFRSRGAKEKRRVNRAVKAASQSSRRTHPHGRMSVQTSHFLAWHAQSSGAWKSRQRDDAASAPGSWRRREGGA